MAPETTSFSLTSVAYSFWREIMAGLKFMFLFFPLKLQDILPRLGINNLKARREGPLTQRKLFWPLPCSIFFRETDIADGIRDLHLNHEEGQVASVQFHSTLIKLCFVIVLGVNVLDGVWIPSNKYCRRAHVNLKKLCKFVRSPLEKMLMFPHTHLVLSLPANIIPRSCHRPKAIDATPCSRMTRYDVVRWNVWTLQLEGRILNSEICLLANLCVKSRDNYLVKESTPPSDEEAQLGIRLTRC